MSRLPCKTTACLALAAICGVASTLLHAQDPPEQDPPKQEPPKVDWDEASANLAFALLASNYLGMPLDGTQKEITVAVIGDSRFGRAVAALTTGKKTRKPQQLPFRVVTVGDKDLLEQKAKWSTCSVVVFATDDPKAQTQALAIMAGKRSLLLGRSPGFIAAGGHLNIWLSKDNKPRYELDHKALLKMGVKLSSTVIKSSRPEEAK
ncbi:MAG: YfiR family protein [Planctomycetes bacterium]|nr:YfiR family protein [Planctomycetota bacterium]